MISDLRMSSGTTWCVEPLKRDSTVQPKLAEVHLFPDGVALERLLILRLILLGGWLLCTITTEGHLMYLHISEQHLFIFYFIFAVQGWLLWLTIHPNRACFLCSHPKRHFFFFISVGCLFCWQALLRNTCPLEKHGSEAPVSGKRCCWGVFI